MTLFRKKTASRRPDSLDVFIVAHEDDWQLFMGDVALRVIRSGAPTVFVYLTAGDAGRPAPYWQAREQGALASVAFAFGAPPPDDAGKPGGSKFRFSCGRTSLAGHRVRRCELKNSVSYFLRLPDGDVEGGGFASMGEQSLSRFEAGTLARLRPVDKSAAYRGWRDLAAVVTAAIIAEIGSADAGVPVRLHAIDPDPAFNPRDHADHRTTGRLSASLAAANGWMITQYAGYSTTAWPSNLSPEQFADKAALFMAYDRARLLANAAWSAYAEEPKPYNAWLSRTYVRPPGFSGTSI